MSLRQRLARAIGLLRRQGGVLPKALIMLASVSLSLRRNGYNQTKRKLDTRAAGFAGAAAPGDANGFGETSRAGEHAKSHSDRQVDEARDVAFIVRLAARVIPDATCLRKALVLQHLLAGRGIPASVQFGATRRPDDDAMSFHAWVEVFGQVVSEEPKAVAAYSLLMDEPPPL